jgi:hypothetical protein
MPERSRRHETPVHQNLHQLPPEMEYRQVAVLPPLRPHTSGLTPTTTHLNVQDAQVRESMSSKSSDSGFFSKTVTWTSLF